MALIIENGTNVAGSNSYIDLADLRAYALNRGVTLSAVDADLEPLVFKAMDYIESFRSQFQGIKTYLTQSLQWPRAEPVAGQVFFDGPVASAYGIFIDCLRIDNNVIPQTLIDLESQVVMAINDGVDFANYGQDQKFAIKEKVGPLEQEYSETLRTGSSVSINSINDYLDVLFFPCGNQGGLTTLRK